MITTTLSQPIDRHYLRHTSSYFTFLRNVLKHNFVFRPKIIHISFLKEALITKHSPTMTESAAATLNNTNLNDQSQRVQENIAVQVELTKIITTDEQSSDSSIDRDSLHTVHRLYVTTNAEDVLDHESIARENSANAPDVSLSKNRRVVDLTIERLISTGSGATGATDLGPVMGYAEEPLLPLFKACVPLTDIIHNLSFYVEMALKETSEEPPDGLTIDESAAIRLYTMEWDETYPSLYLMLNHTLTKADREHLRPYFKFLKLFLTALVKLPCIPPLTIWRGVTKNLSAQFPPDTQVTWWGFSSCTTELGVLENNVYLGDTGDRTLFSVEAINGRAIRAHSHYSTEDEILLLPGTQMVVKSQLSPASDLHIIHLVQIKPQEMLLEPPFEGKSNKSRSLSFIENIFPL